jgi:hypothetical protein
MSNSFIKAQEFSHLPPITIRFAPLLTKMIHFVMETCAKHNIDSSHGLIHSINVLHYAKNIYDEEVKIKPHLLLQERLIYISAILHDMCDKKYMDEEQGLQEIIKFLNNNIDMCEGERLNSVTLVKEFEIIAIKDIISTMSYSKVKAIGFPELGVYQDAYHIVREADLLTGYDFDRCLTYRLNKSLCSIEEAYKESCELFENRIFTMHIDGLFLTTYAKKHYLSLQINALYQISRWLPLINHTKLG